MTLAGGRWVLSVRPGAGWAPVGAAWSKRRDTRTNRPCGQSCCKSGAQSAPELRRGLSGSVYRRVKSGSRHPGRTEASGECGGHASEPRRVRQGRGQAGESRPGEPAELRSSATHPQARDLLRAAYPEKRIQCSICLHENQNQCRSINSSDTCESQLNHLC